MPTKAMSSTHAQFSNLLNLEFGLDGKMQNGTDSATAIPKVQSNAVLIDSRLMSRSRIDRF
jgi:hypothetical protein